MIFQEPMTALNPVVPIGYQIAETSGAPGRLASEARERAVDAARRRSASPAPERRVGTIRTSSRAACASASMIAIALACGPTLLIADEPTTALDVTIQAQISSCSRELREELGMAVLLITHDLGVVAQIADRVAVMYAGRGRRGRRRRELFDAPRHPYTQGLLGSMPALAAAREAATGDPGRRARPGELPAGCRFRAPLPQSRRPSADAAASADSRRTAMATSSAAASHCRCARLTRCS